LDFIKDIITAIVSLAPVADC